jgi:hypothetical protein
MPGAIETFLTEDHARLDRLLERAQRADPAVDADAYAELRRGLLRHIAMEERVLLPFARAARHGEPLATAAQIRADHAAIARLLAPTPGPGLLGELCVLLGRHNALEEGPRGLYATCDELAGAEVDEVIERLRGAQ